MNSTSLERSLMLMRCAESQTSLDLARLGEQSIQYAIMKIRETEPGS